MIVIGELINGMYRHVARAIDSRQEDIIQSLASDQVKAGANILDVNTGPYSKNPEEDMKWLVNVIQKVVDVPLSLDSTKTSVIEEGLRLAKTRAVINSTSAEEEQMSEIFALAKKYNSQVIGIAMDKTGVPNSRDKRLEMAAKIVTKASESGFNTEDLYLDPVLLPVNVAQPQAVEVLDSIRDFRMLCEPKPNTVVGLSNFSQGAKKHRGLLNRTFLTMAIASGLTAAILDPLDKELMDAMIAAELVVNKNVYCDSFVDAYRKK